MDTGLEGAGWCIVSKIKCCPECYLDHDESYNGCVGCGATLRTIDLKDVETVARCLEHLKCEAGDIVVITDDELDAARRLQGR